MTTVYLAVAVGAVLAGFVQGLAGFGFGLAAMSVWAWMLDPQLAAALGVFGALAGQILALFTVRRGFALATLWPFVAGGLAGVPLGTYILPQLDSVLFKLILGLLLVLWCPAMLLSARLPRIRHGGRLANAAVGMVGGVMGGLGGFSGVLPTLWCTLRGMAKDTQRSVIQHFNLTMLVVTAAGYLWHGIVTPDMLPMFAVVLPAMLLPAIAGARLYAGISDTGFKRVVLGLLTASGVAMLAWSLPRFLERLG